MRTLLLLTIAFSLLADPITAGKYAGSWQGSAASGDFKLTLTPLSEAKWDADVTFTLGASEVKCKVKSVAVAESKVNVVYTFELEGYQLESTIDGEMNGKTLGGKYRTRALADGSAIDEGTWQTTAAAQ